MRSGRGKGEEKYVWALSTQRSMRFVGYAARAQLRSAIKISYTVVTPACKLPVFLLHYVIAEKGVGHAIYGEEGTTVCRGIVQG